LAAVAQIRHVAIAVRVDKVATTANSLLSGPNATAPFDGREVLRHPVSAAIFAAKLAVGTYEQWPVVRVFSTFAIARCVDNAVSAAGFCIRVLAVKTGTVTRFLLVARANARAVETLSITVDNAAAIAVFRIGKFARRARVTKSIVAVAYGGLV
jgi:hypothetical protein